MLECVLTPRPRLNLVLSSGGSVSVVYGCMVSAVGALATGLSLYVVPPSTPLTTPSAELCHVYPVTGGQYDWICKQPGRTE